MVPDSERLADGVSRRKIIAAMGGTGIAGCSSSSGKNPKASGGTADEDSVSTSTAQNAASTGPLEAGGSSTVYSIANKAASY